MKKDAHWFEAAYVAGIANAVNVVADALAPAPGLAIIEPVPEQGGDRRLKPLFAEMREFHDLADVPLAFRMLARDPGYLKELWAAWKRAFASRHLARPVKHALAFAVSLTTRSAFGTRFHAAQMRRLGVSDKGLLEIVGVAQMFSSYTKIADVLQIEPDMADIADGPGSDVEG